MSLDVVLATHNAGKVEEFRAMLAGASPEWASAPTTVPNRSKTV